jgi:hypothetical protein
MIPLREDGPWAHWAETGRSPEKSSDVTLVD